MFNEPLKIRRWAGAVAAVTLSACGAPLIPDVDDSGLPDGGLSADAGADGGEGVDAGPDAGRVLDAGHLTDAGSQMDGGHPVDGGFPVDAGPDAWRAYCPTAQDLA